MTTIPEETGIRAAWPTKHVLSEAETLIRVSSGCQYLRNYGHFREAKACNKLSL